MPAPGIGHAWLREAMRAYGYNRNTSDIVSGGHTPYRHRFGQPPHGAVIPFGRRAGYMPDSERDTRLLQQFVPKLRTGIFRDHHTRNVGTWVGGY